jgi:prevent-host-death family protein
MCYMSDDAVHTEFTDIALPDAQMAPAELADVDQVGVRQLRQNASALLDRVATGVTIRITNHGRPVAQLTPLGGQRQGRADLIATGDLQPGRGDVLGVEPVQASQGAPSTDELLAGLREDR